MEENSFLRRLLTSFRGAENNYPGQLKKYQNIFFKQFAGEQDVIHHLAHTLSEKLADTDIIKRLTSQIETRNIPAYFTLTHIAQALKRQLTYYGRMKPFASSHYCEELDLIKPFIPELDRFWEKSQQNLLNGLRSKHGFTLMEIEAILKNIEQYLIQIDTYYYELKPFTQYETGSKQVPIDIYTEQHITKLLSLIERFKTEIKSTQSLVKSLKTKLAQRELQVLYN